MSEPSWRSVIHYLLYLGVLIELLHCMSQSLCGQSPGWSALFFAAVKGDAAIAKFLIKAGADPSLTDQVLW